uniref:Uncharacterized protein n=1 Tax=Labrus bergylta TaxID=56723 RepID=A0A3Q3F7T4_9LABR
LVELIRNMQRFLKLGLQVDVLRETGRQYPVFCFLLLSMISVTVLLNRYIHILMVFWSFLAGVITFYCSSDQSLFSKYLLQRELFPLGHSCAVCGRPTLLLENHQPWYPSQTSLLLCLTPNIETLSSGELRVPWYRDITDDEACVDELRMTFRFFASVLVRRAQKVKLKLSSAAVRGDASLKI